MFGGGGGVYLNYVAKGVLAEQWIQYYFPVQLKESS